MSSDSLVTQQDLLRFLTAGSVDDGKSTLIGRLLFDSKGVYDDHLKGLVRDSKRVGSAGEGIDYSLLLDGLQSEREQGITIDVAYRYFSTPRRKFIVADCPGHEQYTRNMATGASTADLALILLDATKGVLDQTRRHSFIASLLGIKHLVFVVNKMDLVDFQEETFQRIKQSVVQFVAKLETAHIHFIPVSALCGDGVVERSEKMKWFQGAPLLSYLENVTTASDRNFIDFRLPLQFALRQESGFRGYCGTIASGLLRKGDEVLALPSNQRTKVDSIITYDGEVDIAFPPMAVTLKLEDEIDLSRGDMLVKPKNLPRVSSDLEASIVWMNETESTADRAYRMKIGTKTTQAQISTFYHRFDVNTMHRVPCDALGLNDIGRVRLSLGRPIAFDTYGRNRRTGSFILIDPTTNATVAPAWDRSLRLGADSHAPCCALFRAAPSCRIGPDEKKGVEDHPGERNGCRPALDKADLQGRPVRTVHEGMDLAVLPEPAVADPTAGPQTTTHAAPGPVPTISGLRRRRRQRR